MKPLEAHVFGMKEYLQLSVKCSNLRNAESGMNLPFQLRKNPSLDRLVFIQSLRDLTDVGRLGLVIKGAEK